LTVLGSVRTMRGTSPVAAAYGSAFVRIVHRVLAAACKTLPAKLSDEEEPSITGMIVERMRAFLEQPSAPRWAARLAIHDDPPLNVGGLRGKRRLRIDIEVESVIAGVRPRFQFEAKRLYQSKSAADYIGADGLGSFVAERYGKDHTAAGMLAYVQTDSVDDWVKKVASKLDKERTTAGLPAKGAVWEAFAPPDHDLPSFRSIHQRKSTPITVFHTFLSCS
jgi:hypothetical protein